MALMWLAFRLLGDKRAGTETNTESQITPRTLNASITHWLLARNLYQLQQYICYIDAHFIAHWNCSRAFRDWITNRAHKPLCLCHENICIGARGANKKRCFVNFSATEDLKYSLSGTSRLPQLLSLPGTPYNTEKQAFFNMVFSQTSSFLHSHLLCTYVSYVHKSVHKGFTF